MQNDYIVWYLNSRKKITGIKVQAATKENAKRIFGTLYNFEIIKIERMKSHV